jgi:acetyl esterase/lipase
MASFFLPSQVPGADSPRFSQFTIHSTPYKTINEQPIPLHVLLPKSPKITSGPRPILVHFHGGFLFSGDALYPDWAAKWALQYAEFHSAIHIRANYRLLPEATGLEILSDVRDLFSWIETKLAGYLKSIGSRYEPDLGKLMVYGESAGGYLSIQAGLMRPDLVNAVIAAYPMTDLDNPWYAEKGTHKAPFEMPQFPVAVLDSHLSAIMPGKIVTGEFPPARMEVAICTLQQGRLLEFLGKDEKMFPLKVIEKMNGDEKIPFLFVLQGKEDNAVLATEAEKFVGAWEGKFGKRGIVAIFEPGPHGFDTELEMDEPCLQEGLAGVTKSWIG